MTPGALGPIDAAEAAEGADDLDEVELADLNLETMVWTGRRRLGSSRVCDVVVRDWKARAASLVDSVVERADVVTFSAALVASTTAGCGLTGPHHASTCACSASTLRSAWHCEHALSMPRLASNAGRGIGMVWSERAKRSRVPTAGSCRNGMWHAVHTSPVDPSGWCVCAGESSALLAWQPVHCASSKRPSSFLPKTSRYFCECGSWQSVHVIEPLT